jgi:hypothetical protein
MHSLHVAEVGYGWLLPAGQSSHDVLPSWACFDPKNFPAAQISQSAVVFAANLPREHVSH